jgi:hypothetical protein
VSWTWADKVAGLVCPYCYESFSEREIKFRCSGRNSRVGRVCPRSIDEVMERQVGRRMALPPVFDGDGRMRTAQCPRCQDETSSHVCPFCHTQLPLHFGKVPTRLIAMVGARESGKTVFVTVLLHELMHRVGARFDASVAASDDWTRSRFGAEYEGRLYQHRELFGATRSAAATGNLVAPMVFRFAVQRRGRFGRPATARSLLSFFDTAGEDLTSQDSVDLNARYLASADGIIVLLDPLQMPGARALAAPGSSLPPPAPAAASPVSVLTRVTELLEARTRGGSSARVRKPVAVAVSKLDVLWHCLPEDSPLRRQPPGGPAFDSRDSLEVHDHVRALLDDWGGFQVDQLLKHHYARYRCFGFSSLGESPTEQNRLSMRGVQPYRVADPFLWLLAEFGTIPAGGS